MAMMICFSLSIFLDFLMFYIASLDKLVSPHINNLVAVRKNTYQCVYNQYYNHGAVSLNTYLIIGGNCDLIAVLADTLFVWKTTTRVTVLLKIHQLVYNQYCDHGRSTLNTQLIIGVAMTLITMLTNTVFVWRTATRVVVLINLEFILNLFFNCFYTRLYLVFLF